jgi:paraquat-inducible protein A
VSTASSEPVVEASTPVVPPSVEPELDDGLPHRPLAVARPDLLVCEHCDALHSLQALRSDEIARCSRCGAVLGRGHSLGLDGVLALVVAATVLLVLANAYPIVTLNLRGIRNEATLPDAVWSTWQLGEPLVAIIALATAVIAPLAVLVLRLYVMVPLALGRVPQGFRTAMRSMHFMSRWSMVEVLLFGTLVALVRIAGMASVIPGAGLISFLFLALLLASIEAAGTQRIWERAAELRA